MWRSALTELSDWCSWARCASVAPGTNATLRALQDPDGRPKFPREPVPDEMASFEPAEEFVLDQDWFNSNLRKARRGVVVGPSGMNADHLCGEQGKGGGAPLMPILFCLGQHAVLASVKREFFEGEQLFAFLDDLYVVCNSERVVEVHRILSNKFWGARPHLSPRGENEVEQEWHGAQRLSRSSRSSSVGHSRTVVNFQRPVDVVRS